MTAGPMGFVTGPEWGLKCGKSRQDRSAAPFPRRAQTRLLRRERGNPGQRFEVPVVVKDGQAVTQSAFLVGGTEQGSQPTSDIIAGGPGDDEEDHLSGRAERVRAPGCGGCYEARNSWSRISVMKRSRETG